MAPNNAAIVTYAGATNPLNVGTGITAPSHHDVHELSAPR